MRGIQYAADVTFLPVLRGQRARAATLEVTCVDEGRTRWAERNHKDIERARRHRLEAGRN